MSQRLLLVAQLLLIGCLALQPLAADKLVDVNTASEQEICALPGVGNDLAKKIVAARPYASLDDLRRSGISAELLKQIATKITVSRIQSEPPGGQAGMLSKVQRPATQTWGAEAYTAPFDPLHPSEPRSSARKRIAILDFDYAKVQSDSSAIFGENVDIGKGIADLLGKRLGGDANYIVVEGRATDRLLAEQGFSNSERADRASAMRIGKLLGVDAVITGSITKFGRDDKGIKPGANVHYGMFGGIGGISATHPSKAVVGINARLVNVRTGEILAVAEGNGEASRSGTAMIGAGGVATGAGGVNMSSESFAATILGEATTKAVAEMVANLDREASATPREAASPLEGLVAYVSGASLVLNVGSAQGLHVGERLTVWREALTTMDPAAGSVVKHVETALGEVTITKVEANSASASYSGPRHIRVGDRVKR